MRLEKGLSVKKFFLPHEENITIRLGDGMCVLCKLIPNELSENEMGSP